MSDTVIGYAEVLAMLDALMAQTEAESAVTCAQMETQELTLMRLQQLRQTLKPQDDAQMAAIADYYRRKSGAV